MNNLTPTQITDLINACDSFRDKALLALMYQCGLRRGEVRFLLRSEYLDGKLLVTREKSKVRHWVHLWDRTQKYLDSYLRSRTDDSLFLFLSRKKNQGLGAQGVYYVYLEAAKKIQLDKELQHPHCLRHAIAQHLSMAGLDISEIRKHLGHLDSKGTVLYVEGARSSSYYNIEVAEANAHVSRF